MLPLRRPFPNQIVWRKAAGVAAAGPGRRLPSITMKAVWWGVIGLSLFAVLRVWWSWSGPCIGVPGDEMSCRLEPDASWPVALGVTVVAFAAITSAVVALIRRRIPTTRHT